MAVRVHGMERWAQSMVVLLAASVRAARAYNDDDDFCMDDMRGWVRTEDCEHGCCINEHCGEEDECRTLLWIGLGVMAAGCFCCSCIAAFCIMQARKQAGRHNQGAYNQQPMLGGAPPPMAGDYPPPPGAVPVYPAMGGYNQYPQATAPPYEPVVGQPMGAPPIVMGQPMGAPGAPPMTTAPGAPPADAPPAGCTAAPAPDLVA